MKILILGACGFIGQNAVKYFSKGGNEVYSADIIYSTKPNYFQILKKENYQEIFSSHQYDVCLNAAGSAHVQFSFQHPLKDFSLNTTFVYEILSYIKVHNPKCKFINLSSAAVYGNPKHLPIKETHEVNPLSPYGLHKYYSELICKEFHKYFGLHTCSLRIFSAYGNGLKKQLFWDLYQKTLSNQTLTMYGTGNETRDFIYILDLLQAIELIIKKGDFESNIYNVANGEEISILEATQTFKEIINPKIKIQFNQQAKLGDPLNWKADITCIKAMGYKPQYTLQHGLTAYYQWIKESI